jgi:hypothetical protein
MGTINDTKKTTRQMAQQIAKQIAQEPLEILKQAGEQVANTEAPKEPPEEKKEQTPPELKKKIAVQDQRHLQAYEKEIEDIRREKIFADLQRRIAEGEEITLTDFPELSREQIEVLQAQQMAVSVRKEEAEKQKPLVEPSTKQSRDLFGRGQKAQAEKQKTHVERPLPPSG